MATSFTNIPTPSIIESTRRALETAGITSTQVADEQAAMEEVQRLVPKGAAILANTSRTLEETGILDMIEHSGDYNSLRETFKKLMVDPSKSDEKRRLGAAPDYAIGSAQAITETGELLFASMTGSQLPGYAFGAGKVFLIVGTHKIVKDIAEARKRLFEYVFPLEDVRAQKAYGIHSQVNKELIIRGDTPGRIHVIFVDKILGF